MAASERLWNLLAAGQTLVMPDAFDPISARIIERSGFPAVQCSGFSMATSLCHQHESDLSLEENLEITRRIVAAVTVPVMADGEDGYGDATSVHATLRAFIFTGVAGINLEDLASGSTSSKHIVDESLMIDKLVAAREAADAEDQPEFIINARTDALAAFDDRVVGLSTAIERANSYLTAGADLAFVARVESLDEVRVLIREIDGPVSIAAGLPYNIDAFSIEDLRREGVARVTLPSLALFASVTAMTRVLRWVNDSAGFDGLSEGGVLGAPEEIMELLRS